ncbi:hypothetical protein PPJ95_03510 [Limosilactobacillus reuteri]|uniref:hypothetical protein n=1 Tax=Limosilactobacillus reuteri TaxID=1598 RepID=UPI002349ADD7|nr:hypothetical protein [Limosilactobacillus reuteri]MDC6076635.1 hypothetical protein [Limosilactobacillus reuteri]
MSEFKLPHVEDLDTNSYLIRQLIENFKRIEQELANLSETNEKLKKLQNALGLSDDDLNNL